MEAYLRGQYDTGYGLRADGVVDENFAFFSTKTGQLLAFNLSRLARGPQWVYELKTANPARPSAPFSALEPFFSRDPLHKNSSTNHLCSRVLYIGGVESINSCSGKRIWKASVPFSESSDPVAGGGMVFVATFDHRTSLVVALDSATGRMMFNTTLTAIAGGGTGAPTSVVYSEKQGTVYLGTSSALTLTGSLSNPSHHDGFFFCVDAKNGSVRWQFMPAHGTSFLIPPVGADTFNAVYIPSVSNSNDVFMLHGLDTRTGKEIWRHKFLASILAKPLVDATSNILYVAVSDGTLAAVRLLDGVTRWVVGGHRTSSSSSPSIFDSGFLASPALGLTGSGKLNGKIYIGSNIGTIYSIDAASGSVVWSHHLGGAAGLTSRTIFSNRPITDYSWDSRLNRTVRATSAYMIIQASLDGHIYALSERAYPTAVPTPVPSMVENEPQAYPERRPVVSVEPDRPPTASPNPFTVVSIINMGSGGGDEGNYALLSLLALLLLSLCGYLAYSRRWFGSSCCAQENRTSRMGGKGASLTILELSSSVQSPLHGSMNRPPPSMSVVWTDEESKQEGEGLLADS